METTVHPEHKAELSSISQFGDSPARLSLHLILSYPDPAGGTNDRWVFVQRVEDEAAHHWSLIIYR